jgi:mannose-1-phosphate guanylyltransferase
MSAIIPVILCGGSGTRLWPRSRKARPKPFLPLLGERTLFEDTLLRCADSERFDPAIVVTGTDHLGHIKDQLCGLPGASVIVEPEPKNTAAAIALAAMRLPEDAVMLVCPSDHHIADCDAFVAAAGSAASLAADGWLVSFGIEPRTPETGFGYIRRGEPVGVDGYKVAQFIEKPERVTAEEFLAAGGYAWNGGIFAFRAGTFLEELRHHRPALANAVARAVAGGREDGALFHPEAGAFADIEAESVDYAVMENTRKAAMVPAAMGWSDIGNWHALHEASARDPEGNAVRGPAQLLDCRNVMVETDGPRVSAIGLEDVIIVVAGDEVLVTTRAGAQLVGKLDGPAGR